MKALSIRQPWAWLILHAGKDIENRDWPTHLRGRVAIHAAKGMTKAEYQEASDFAWALCRVDVPHFEDLPRGGIVGTVEIVDCVTGHPSLWFFGRYGFVLGEPREVPFAPLRGQLGFFDVDLGPKVAR